MQPLRGCKQGVNLYQNRVSRLVSQYTYDDWSGRLPVIDFVAVACISPNRDLIFFVCPLRYFFEYFIKMLKVVITLNNGVEKEFDLRQVQVASDKSPAKVIHACHACVILEDQGDIVTYPWSNIQNIVISSDHQSYSQ